MTDKCGLRGSPRVVSAGLCGWFGGRGKGK